MLGKIKVTNFSKRHFEKGFSGTKITNKTPEEFEVVLNQLVNKYDTLDGYADFCKLIVVPNFTNARIGSMPIDMSNYQYLRHGYSSRTDKELAVLSRWFELPIPASIANWLVVIVYSREQLKKEHDADLKKKFDTYEKERGTVLDDQARIAMSSIKGFGFEFENSDVEWGVVAILGQNHPREEPMQPITMMRNALGVEEGGSGVPLNREKYIESVEFWSNNAIIKS